ncbi:hypothetical protein, partial [Microvirga tunisiensis]|uniref:hypothetical protein n=1 Tax=Microvirga tunisiensis TaxID=2108360 RepID=UPI001AEDBEE7
MTVFETSRSDIRFVKFDKTLSVPVPKTLSNSDLASPYFPVVHEAVSGVAEYIGLYLSGNR